MTLKILQIVFAMLLAGLASILAFIPLTALADSPPSFLSMWGFGVDTGAAAFETCLTSTIPCQPGLPGGGDGQFNFPAAIALDSNGNVYVADSLNHRVQKFDSNGTFIKKWGVLSGTAGIAVDGGDNIYVVETFEHRIQKFDSDGNFIRMWGSGPNDGAGQFSSPIGIAVDAANNIYVADANNHRIQQFDSDGAFIQMWGFGVDSGANTIETCTTTCQAGIAGGGDGQFDQPVGIAVDSSGDFYVTNSSIFNIRVQKFDSSGGFIRKWGALGSGDGEFVTPAGIAVDNVDNVYVTDRAVNHRVQKFDSDGNFLTQWGTPGPGAGQLNAPADLVIDSAGAIYVAEESNHRVQKFGQGNLLTLNKTVNNAFPNPGERITYTITVDNNGPISATNAVISDTLPTGLTLAGPVTLQGASGITSSPPVHVSGLTITAETRITLTFPVTVNTGQDNLTVIHNIAAITSSEVLTPQTDSEPIILLDITQPIFITTDLDTLSPLITPTLGVLLDNIPPVFEWHAAFDNGQTLTYTLTITGSDDVWQFQIEGDGDAVPVISFTLTIDLPTGVYTWTLQVQDAAENISGYIPPQNFRIQNRGGRKVYLPAVLKG